MFGDSAMERDMAGNTNVVALMAYVLVGLIIGWGVLVIRDDIRIDKDNQWRRFRAFFLASVCILLTAADREKIITIRCNVCQRNRAERRIRS